MSLSDSLFDLHYELLSETEAESLRDRIERDPELKEEYEKVKRTAALLGQAAKIEPDTPVSFRKIIENGVIDEPDEEKKTVSLPPERPEPISTGITTVFDTNPPSTVRMRPPRTLTGAPDGSSGPRSTDPKFAHEPPRTLLGPITSRFSPYYRGLNRLLVASSMVLIVLSLTGFLIQRNSGPRLSDKLVLVKVLGPGVLARNTSNSLEIEVSDLSGRPKQTPIQLRLFDEQGERFLVYKEKTDSEGKLRLKIDNPKNLPDEVQMEIVAGAESEEHATLQTRLNVVEPPRDSILAALPSLESALAFQSASSSQQSKPLKQADASTFKSQRDFKIDRNTSLFSQRAQSAPLLRAESAALEESAPLTDSAPLADSAALTESVPLAESVPSASQTVSKEARDSQDGLYAMSNAVPRPSAKEQHREPIGEPGVLCEESDSETASDGKKGVAGGIAGISENAGITENARNRGIGGVGIGGNAGLGGVAGFGGKTSTSDRPDHSERGAVLQPGSRAQAEILSDKIEFGDSEPIRFQIRSENPSLSLIAVLSKQGVPLDQIPIATNRNRSVEEFAPDGAQHGLLRISLFDAAENPPKEIAAREVFRRLPHHLKIDRFVRTADAISFRITDEQGIPVPATVRISSAIDPVSEIGRDPVPVLFDNTAQLLSSIERGQETKKPVLSGISTLLKTAGIVGSFGVFLGTFTLLFYRRISGFLPLVLATTAAGLGILLAVSMLHEGQPIVLKSEKQALESLRTQTATATATATATIQKPEIADGNISRDSSVSALPQHCWIGKADTRGMCQIPLSDSPILFRKENDTPESRSIRIEAVAPDQRIGFAEF